MVQSFEPYSSNRYTNCLQACLNELLSFLLAQQSCKLLFCHNFELIANYLCAIHTDQADSLAVVYEIEKRNAVSKHELLNIRRKQES